VCAVCETAGTNFPLAEFVGDDATTHGSSPLADDILRDEADGMPILLICPNCDESFVPRFYRRCEECGHDFGAGVELQEEEPAQVNYRTALVTLGLVVLAAALIAYFGLLLR
jgi:hypothetical protein